MPEIYYTDESVTLWHGDAAAILTELEPASVDCIVTSPPYFGLRDYGVDGQIGAEPSPAEFVAALVAVFHEARRVLTDDGTLWLNLGDSYTSGSRTSYADTGKSAGRIGLSRPSLSLPAKNLLGIPWRVAFALQEDSWILRNDIIWYKPNAMPESVTDRLSGRHEHVFMFTKSPRYWFDLDAVREPFTTVHKSTPATNWRDGALGHNGGETSILRRGWDPANATKNGRNPGDVWTIPTQPYADAHFATMPLTLAEICIQAGCKPNGIVLDPFSGSGTTGLAAAKHGHRYVGIDLNVDYLDLSLRTRLSQSAIDLGNIT